MNLAEKGGRGRREGTGGGGRREYDYGRGEEQRRHIRKVGVFENLMNGECSNDFSRKVELGCGFP